MGDAIAVARGDRIDWAYYLLEFAVDGCGSYQLTDPTCVIVDDKNNSVPGSVFTLCAETAREFGCAGRPNSWSFVPQRIQLAEPRAPVEQHAVVVELAHAPSCTFVYLTVWSETNYPLRVLTPTSHFVVLPLARVVWHEKWDPTQTNTFTAWVVSADQEHTLSPPRLFTRTLEHGCRPHTGSVFVAGASNVDMIVAGLFGAVQMTYYAGLVMRLSDSSDGLDLLVPALFTETKIALVDVCGIDSIFRTALVVCVLSLIGLAAVACVRPSRLAKHGPARMVVAVMTQLIVVCALYATDRRA